MLNTSRITLQSYDVMTMKIRIHSPFRRNESERRGHEFRQLLSVPKSAVLKDEEEEKP